MGDIDRRVGVVVIGIPNRRLGFIAAQQNISSAGLVESLVNKMAGKAYEEIRDYFKSRASEFKQAQAEPQDGVTIRLVWPNVPGLAAVKTIISAIRGNISFNPATLTFPSLPKPEIVVKAGKQFD